MKRDRRPETVGCRREDVHTIYASVRTKAFRTLRAARAAVAPQLNQPIIEAVAEKILEELKP